MKRILLNRQNKIFMLLFISINCTATTNFQHFLDAWRQKNHITSAVVAVDDMKNNKVIYYSSGFLTNKNHEMITANNLYGVGSISNGCKHKYKT